jgi:hypothetical protein
MISESDKLALHEEKDVQSSLPSSNSYMSTKLFFTLSSSILLTYARDIEMKRYRNSNTSAADALHLHSQLSTRGIGTRRSSLRDTDDVDVVNSDVKERC